MLIYMGAVAPLYAFSLFLPTIIKDLGYTSTIAQLLSVPPYAVAAILTVIIGFVADRSRQRGLCNITVSFLGIIGFAMLAGRFKIPLLKMPKCPCLPSERIPFFLSPCQLLSVSLVNSFTGTSNPSVQYAGVYLAALGIYPCISNTISWTANNVEGVYKRGITIGFVVGWGNLNGVVSSNIYRGTDAPRFLPGHGTVVAYLTLFLLGGSILQRFLLVKENKRRSSGGRDGWVEGKSADEIEKLGDKSPDFIYTL